MRRRYLDAMALVQCFGKPDLFITITCNPNWPEIKEHLLPNEEAHNRPDLTARVFHAKFRELKEDLIKKKCFGHIRAYAYTIEFQKRGLPHGHILLIFNPADRLVTPDEYNQIVSAEIPPRNLHPLLHDAVKKHMMHGPCGALNKSNVCMRDGKRCANYYPKEFCRETMQSKNSYPLYRRRDSGVTVFVKGHQLSNEWVVPYNPFLLLKYDCHVNVEICASIHSIKYIYKYIYKGHDKIHFHVSPTGQVDQVDEIKDFQSARWVSPQEAAWRIFGFDLTELKPSVIHLQLHLENYQLIHFNTKDRLANVLRNPRNHKTMLTEFFFANRSSPRVREMQLTYDQFPKHFVWMQKDKYWKRRVKQDALGRINLAHPSEGERFFLRMLLMVVKAPTSFDALKTYNGQIFPTFRAACLA